MVRYWNLDIFPIIILIGLFLIAAMKQADKNKQSISLVLIGLLSFLVLNYLIKIE